MQFEELKSILDKKMTRKEFLMNIGIIIVTLLGITSAIKTITSTISGKKQSIGYGSTAYGK